MSSAQHPASIFSVTPGSPEPIYQQLVAQTSRLVASGQLAPGDRVPSVRDVATHLAVNPMTVSKAYALLESQGVLERLRGVGMAVAARQGGAQRKADRVEQLRPTLTRAAEEARQLEVDPAAALAMFERILKRR